MSDQCTYGILLANTGTPSAPTEKEIKKFLGRFLMDRRIVPLNRVLWWILLHTRILPKRGKSNVAKYESIWTDEGSPFEVGHRKLVAGLNATFQQEGRFDVCVACGHSYGNPDVRAGLEELRQAGCTQVIVLPLYPQSAHSTTGAVYDAVKRAMKKMRWDVECELIDNYHDNTMYLKAIAASIRHAGFEVHSDDRLVFSFHSIPLKDIEAGDTYELQTGASSLQIASELDIDRKRWTIGYQCRFDKGREWLSPFTYETLSRWAQAGEGRVFYVCPGFSVDCLETLYDVDHEMEPHFRQACEEEGKVCKVDGFVYVPCLDRSKAHVKVLKDVIYPYIEK